jgi:nucleotide-binding universal stress UspA family protein
MAEIQKILVPVDFSDAAANAVRYAEALAARFNAHVTMLHVAPPIHFGFAMVQPTERRYEELARHRNQTLRSVFEGFPADPPLRRPVRRELAEGEPSEEIVRCAHDEGFDLILMPTRGNSPIKRWLIIGSVTSKVLHEAECPVLAGVEFDKGRGPTALTQILCAIDLGSQSTRVLCWASGLARQFDARLTVVHATAGAGDTAEDFFDESWRTTLKSRVHRKIVDLMRQGGVDGDIVIEAGDPHKVVARTARGLDAGLVVIGRGVSDGLLGRLRAHAYEIIRQAPCPVVSV